MTASDANQLALPFGGDPRPRYEFGRREAEIIAHFGSSARLPVVRGRIRSYPGLPSGAPITLAFYRAFAPLFDERHIVDAGSGAGAGARLLCERSGHVTGIDNDPRALAFAREYAANAEFFQADLCHGLPIDRADAAVLVDVLGHLKHPAPALRSLRACLPVGARLLVAEPRAYAAQRLVAPARRAFSNSELVRILLRTGFEAEAPTAGPSNFVALLARRASSIEHDALVEGFRLLERGEASDARREFSRVLPSESLALRREAVLGDAEAALAGGDGDRAVQSYFAANALDANDGRALAGLARIALLTGDANAALELAFDAVKREPTELSGQVALGLAAERLDHVEAFNAWRIAANVSPDDGDVAVSLARVAAARHRYGFAIQALERLRHYEDAFSPEFHTTLAWLLLADGRKSDANVEAHHAAALAPSDAAVQDLLNTLAS